MKRYFRLISAMCAIGELYMTDMCDEADAEENCKKYLEGVGRAELLISG